MRQLSDRMDFFNAKPRNDLLADRADNEAYCRAIEGKSYAIYFTAGGAVTLDTSGADGSAEIAWLDVLKAQWSE